MRTCIACGRPLNLASALVVWVIAGIDGGIAPRHRSCGEAAAADLRAA